MNVQNPDAGDIGSYTAFVYACFAGLAVIITFPYLPEMRGRSAHEIDRMFDLGLKGQRLPAVVQRRGHRLDLHAVSTAAIGVYGPQVLLALAATAINPPSRQYGLCSVERGPVGTRCAISAIAPKCSMSQSHAFHSSLRSSSFHFDTNRAMEFSKLVSAEEVSRHNAPSDLWIVIEDTVWDVSSFATEHPGGVACKSSPDNKPLFWSAWLMFCTQ